MIASNKPRQQPQLIGHRFLPGLATQGMTTSPVLSHPPAQANVHHTQYTIPSSRPLALPPADAKPGPIRCGLSATSTKHQAQTRQAMHCPNQASPVDQTEGQKLPSRRPASRMYKMMPRPMSTHTMSPSTSSPNRLSSRDQAPRQKAMTPNRAARMGCARARACVCVCARVCVYMCICVCGCVWVCVCVCVYLWEVIYCEVGGK